MLRVSLRSWLGNWQEWGVIILLFLTLEIAVGSVEQAQWITPQPSLTLVLVLAVLTGWLLCQSRLTVAVIHPLAVALGAAVTVWQASNLLPSPEITSRVGQLAVALQSWWEATSAAKPSEGTIHFAVFLIFFTWIIGYTSIWFMLRRQNVWVTISLSAITILINLANLPEQKYIFFLFYLLTALLLVGMTNLARQQYWFKKHDISYPNRGVIYLMASLLGLSILMVATAWLTPEVQVERLETFITAKTRWVKNIENLFNNLLASVPAKQSFLSSDEEKALSFGDSSFNRGDELHFVVVSDRSYYLRSRMYDIYTSSGWMSSNAPEQGLGQGISSPQDDGISRRREITYTVVAKVKTDSLLTAGEFISSDVPVSVQSLAPLNYNIDLLHPNNDRSLPEDVASLARSLRARQDADKEISLDELWSLLPGDLRLNDFSSTHSTLIADEYATGLIPVSAHLSTVKVTRTPPASGDTVAVTSLRSLRPGRRYAVTTSISSATAEDLSGAGENSPYWVTGYYLQLPLTLPERLRQLSERVTKEARTPYDKAVAIKNYLAQFAYTVEAKAPPQGVDGVDSFIFTQKSGNCVDFASTMVVMLRSVGIPSRLSSGYSPGSWDAATGSSTLRAKNRHTWPEVYFPGYGWVGFEATPEANTEPEAIAGIGGIGRSLPFDEYQDEGLFSGGGSVATGSVAATSRNQWWITIFFATGAVLLVYVLWSSVLSHRRQRLVRSDYASEIYRKMCFRASLVRLGPQPQQTPLEYCARLASVFPIQAEAIDCIAQTYVARRFSRRKELDYRQTGRLRQSWHKVSPLLLRRLFRIRHRPRN